MNCLVVDDEAAARDHLAAVIVGLGHDAVVAKSAEEALSVLTRTPFDIVFLDIHMPGLDGMEIARVMEQMKDPPLVAFVTAHSKYAVGAFDVNAIDYVLKPYDDERIHRVLERAAGRFVTTDEAARKTTGIPVRKAERTIFIPLETVLFAEASGDYAYIVVGSDRHLVSYTLSDLHQRHFDHRFLRVHRRYTVNVDHVSEVSPLPGGSMLLRLGTPPKAEVRVSRRRAPNVKRRLGLH